MIDLRMTDDGELTLAENGDLSITYGDEQVAQEVLFRLKTTRGDWVLSPRIGCDLEQFIGKSNTRLVHASIELEVTRAITEGGLLFFPEVSAVPISDNEVLILVEFGSIEVDGRVIQIQSSLDLRKGLVFARATTRDIG